MGTYNWCSLRAFLVILGILAATALPAVAQTGPLQSSWLGQSYVLQSDGRESLLEISHGATVRLPSPQGATYSSLTALQNGWIAVGDFDARDGAHRLFVVRGQGSEFEIISPPRNQRKSTRQDAVILAENGELVGLAWLEGDTRKSLDVRYSEWNGSRWRSPKRVATRARGSQLALSGTVLKDGSWLLAWSAFDGRDDEILWAQRRNREWQPPKRLGAGNSVPDIVPAVAACGDGAVAAWSRYDGEDYRLLLAHFDGEDWQPEVMQPGAGSLYPVFYQPAEVPGVSGSGPSILFREVSVRGWAALGLDDNGSIVSRASASSAPSQRPVLENTGDELFLRWHQQEQRANLSWQAMPAEAPALSSSSLGSSDQAGHSETQLP